MSVRDLLVKITSGDVEGIQDTFDALMAEKTAARIDEKRIELAQKMFGEGKTPYEVGKDEKEAEDADDAADEADKKVTKDKGGDDSDSKDALADKGAADDSEDDSKDKGAADDSEDDSKDDSEDKQDDKKKFAFGKK